MCQTTEISDFGPIITTQEIPNGFYMLPITRVAEQGLDDYLKHLDKNQVSEDFQDY